MKFLKYIFRVISDAVDLLNSVPDTSPTRGSKKRILFFNWRDTKHVYTGGAEVYIYEIAKRLVARGYTVTWFCGSDGMSPSYEVIDGIQIVRRGGFYFVYIWAVIYYLFKLRGKYDVIVDCENGIPFFTPLFVKGKKLLVVFHVHQEVFKMSLNEVVFRLASYIESNIVPKVYKNVQCVTISDSARDDMEKMGLGTAGITVISPGISHDTYVPGKKSAKPTVLFVGRLKQYKSIQTLLYAARKILKKRKNIQIIIAGEGEEGTKLKRLSSRLGLKDTVIFTGKVTEERKIELYQQAWVVVNPSVKEGFGMAVLEANACGTPVVASNVAGLCDSIKHNTSGVLVPYADVDAFARETLKILTDETWRYKLSHGAVRWSKNFSWDASTEAFTRALMLQ